MRTGSEIRDGLDGLGRERPPPKGKKRLMTSASAFNGIPVTRRDALLTMGALSFLACDGGLPREQSAEPPTAFRPRDRLGEFLVEHMAAFRIPGMTAWVARGAETRTYAIGHNDIDFDVPVAEDTPYQIASVSKIFAGVAASWTLCTPFGIPPSVADGSQPGLG